MTTRFCDDVVYILVVGKGEKGRNLKRFQIRWRLQVVRWGLKRRISEVGKLDTNSNGGGEREIQISREGFTVYKIEARW